MPLPPVSEKKFTEGFGPGGATTGKLRIIVTGAGGFIASHLSKRLKAEGHFVRGVDWKENEYMEPSEFCDEFKNLDLRWPDKCKEALEDGPWDWCFNLAADMGGMGFIQSNHSRILFNSTTMSGESGFTGDYCLDLLDVVGYGGRVLNYQSNFAAWVLFTLIVVTVLRRSRMTSRCRIIWLLTLDNRIAHDCSSIVCSIVIIVRMKYYLGLTASFKSILPCISILIDFAHPRHAHRIAVDPGVLAVCSMSYVVLRSIMQIFDSSSGQTNA